MFQPVLLLFGVLQTTVDFDDALGYLTQFVAGKLCQVLYVKTFIGGCSLGKDAQLVDVAIETLAETEQQKRQQCHNDKGHPDVALLGLECFGQGVVVGQCRTHNIVLLGKIRC